MKIFTPLSLLFLSLTAAAQSGSQEFTTSGSFTVPAGVTEIFVEVVGAGGNGGYNGTGGGGGGGYASGNFTVTPGAVLDVAIGVPGLGGVTGTTIVEDLLYATGGENGVSVPNPEIGGGGTGGFGNGGNISNFTGGKGGGGYYTYFGGGGGGAAESQKCQEKATRYDVHVRGPMVHEHPGTLDYGQARRNPGSGNGFNNVNRRFSRWKPVRSSPNLANR